MREDERKVVCSALLGMLIRTPEIQACVTSDYLETMRQHEVSWLMGLSLRRLPPEPMQDRLLDNLIQQLTKLNMAASTTVQQQQQQGSYQQVEVTQQLAVLRALENASVQASKDVQEHVLGLVRHDALDRLQELAEGFGLEVSVAYLDAAELILNHPAYRGTALLSELATMICGIEELDDDVAANEEFVNFLQQIREQV